MFFGKICLKKCITKGQLVSKGLFEIFQLFQKTNKNMLRRAYEFLLSFVRFLLVVLLLEIPDGHMLGPNKAQRRPNVALDAQEQPRT